MRDDNWDQPPGVDVHSDHKRLPEMTGAAKRIREFISWFGDGEVLGNAYGKTNPPLYARDLEAVALAVLGKADAWL